jgi:hypothetical protein
MFNILGQRKQAAVQKAEKKKQKQLWGKDFNVVKEGLDEGQIISFVNELMLQGTGAGSARSIIRTAVKSAEDIIENIKTRARAEAEEEASRIIARARKAAGVEAGSKTVLEQEVEDILAVADGAVAEPASLPEEEVAAGPMEVPEDETAETETGRPKQGKNSHYVGEVELAIGVPVDPNVVAKLYNYLQTTPEIKFLRTSGSWNRGTEITVALDKPIQLLSVLSERIPEAEVTPEPKAADGQARGKNGVKRVSIALRSN